MRKLIYAALLSLLPGAALAACASTVSVKDGAGATQTFCVGTDGGTGLFSGTAIYGGLNNANKLSINSSSEAALSVADGSDVTLGAKADAACGTDNGTCSIAALIKRTNQDITTLNTTASAAVPAGTNIIGKFGIDQTTPGTTNLVQESNFPSTVDTNSGNKGSSTPRVVIATDDVAHAAWGQVATGAAPPANVVYLGANASGATGGHVAGLITCDSHVFKHITSATDTLAVQGVASQTIRICGWRSRAAGTATWFLENTASANANCASSLTQITGVATEAINTGETMLAAFWTGLANTSGNGLCINSTGTGGVDIDIWYTQF